MQEIFQFDDVEDDVMVYPFNLNSMDEYNEMFDREAPAKMALALTFLYEDEDGEEHARQILDKILSGAIETGSLGVEQSETTLKYFSAERMPLHLRDAMHDLQKEWWYEGVYVQCGFWNPALADDPSILRGVATAMTWYDASIGSKLGAVMSGPRVMGFEEEEPGDPIPGILARNFRIVVSTIFQEGVGVWNLNLVHHRNEILVKTRAVLSGIDPETAWARFTGAGLSNYLEYTLLPGD